MGKKNIVRVNESRLMEIISECVRKAVNEQFERVTGDFASITYLPMIDMYRVEWHDHIFRDTETDRIQTPGVRNSVRTKKFGSEEEAERYCQENNLKIVSRSSLKNVAFPDVRSIRPNMHPLTESQLHKVIVNSISKVLKEVRYIDTSFANKNSWKDLEHQEPIKNEDRIRVFHGCDLKDAVIFAKHGLSGKERSIRKYSYEQGMNPIGLFVSTSFETVKEFSNPFGGPKDSSKNASVIIEFTAKATDLDTPVWNNSETYFGQGSNPMPFKNKDERDAQKKHYNDNAKNDEHEHVRSSDNPAMASNIFDNREHQALFIGDLNPNMIKRFWVMRFANGSGDGPTDKQYEPMSRSEFLREFGNEEFYVNGTYGKCQYKPIQHSQRLFKPNEDFTSIEDMADRQIKDDLRRRGDFIKEYINEKFGGDFNAWYKEEYEELMDAYKSCIKYGNISDFRYYLWPKQLYQLLGKDTYNEYFDRFGIGFPS